MKKFYVLILSCLLVSSLSAQCVLDGITPGANVTQAQVIACVNAGPHTTIQITGTVNMDGSWDLSSLGDITFQVNNGGSLLFSGSGGNAEELTLSSGSDLDINGTGTIGQSGGGGNVRINIGSASFDGNDFADIIAVGGANQNGLPVELSKFEANSKNNMVELAWTTTSELNNEFFQIEHSRDGLNFNSIGKVRGEGTTSETIAYDFMHRQPISGANYYRLKQVDFDGAFEYSNVVVAVLANRTGGVQVYPNPTINKAMISMNERPDNIKFRLSNLLGQGIDLQPNQVDAGWELDLSSLANGIYVLRMEYNGKVLSKRIIKK